MTAKDSRRCLPHRSHDRRPDADARVGGDLPVEQSGGGRLPALQRHFQPGRHCAGLQGRRGLDHRRLVERVLAQLRDATARNPCRPLLLLYALDYDRGGEWSGQAFMCSRDKEFTIKGTENCLARGYDRTGFFEVDTGEQRAWTVQLTEANEQPAQRVPGIPGTVGPGGPGGVPGLSSGHTGSAASHGAQAMRRLRRSRFSQRSARHRQTAR